MNREEAIKWIIYEKDSIDTEGYCATKENYARIQALDMAIEALNEVQKHEKTFEWCHDCKEYDKDNYCCHRWSKVIRNTVEELKANDEDEPQFYTEDDYWNGMFTESAEAYKDWTGEGMGVYVKGVKHPRDCNECWLAFPNNDWDFTSHCRVIGENCPDDGKLQNCPLVDRPHGFTADEWYRENFGENNGK